MGIDALQTNACFLCSEPSVWHQTQRAMAMATLLHRSIYSWGLTRRVMGPEYQLLGASELFPKQEGPVRLIPTSMPKEGHQDTLPRRHGRSEGSRER